METKWSSSPCKGAQNYPITFLFSPRTHVSFFTFIIEVVGLNEMAMRPQTQAARIGENGNTTNTGRATIIQRLRILFFFLGSILRYLILFSRKIIDSGERAWRSMGELLPKDSCVTIRRAPFLYIRDRLLVYNIRDS